MFYGIWGVLNIHTHIAARTRCAFDAELNTWVMVEQWWEGTAVTVTVAANVDVD